MLDREIVAAIVAGDPDGLAAAYDRYAPGLYAYCQSLLTEPADAATLSRTRSSARPAKLPEPATRIGPAPGCTRGPQ
jgi:hypothetical protein